MAGFWQRQRRTRRGGVLIWLLVIFVHPIVGGALGSVVTPRFRECPRTIVSPVVDVEAIHIPNPAIHDDKSRAIVEFLNVIDRERADNRFRLVLWVVGQPKHILSDLWIAGIEHASGIESPRNFKRKLQSCSIVNKVYDPFRHNFHGGSLAGLLKASTRFNSISNFDCKRGEVSAEFYPWTLIHPHLPLNSFNAVLRCLRLNASRRSLLLSNIKLPFSVHSIHETAGGGGFRLTGHNLRLVGHDLNLTSNENCRSQGSPKSENSDPVCSSRDGKGLFLKWFEVVSSNDLDKGWVRCISALLGLLTGGIGTSLFRDSKRLDRWLSDTTRAELAFLLVFVGLLLICHGILLL